MNILRNKPAGECGQIYLAYAINTFAMQSWMGKLPFAGGYYNFGSKFFYLEMFIELTLEHPEFSYHFRVLSRSKT